MHCNIGDIVWAKMRGKRPLPGTVTAYSDINREVCIEFFGKGESACIFERNVMLYTGHEQCGHFFMGKTTKCLSVAVNQANNFVSATAAENDLSSFLDNNSYQSDSNLNDSSNDALKPHILAYDEQCESNGSQLIMGRNIFERPDSNEENDLSSLVDDWTNAVTRNEQCESNVMARLGSNEMPNSQSDCYANRHVRSLKTIQGSSILQMSSSNNDHLFCNVPNNNTNNTTNLKNAMRQENSSYLKYCQMM